MRLKPKDVHAQTFRVTFRGFDPVEVDGFLNRVSDELERLSEEKANLELEIELERASRKSLEETLESTMSLQEVILQRAKEEAKLITDHAKLEALEIASSAREEIAALKRELAVVREKRSSALADVSGVAHGLAQWVKRYDGRLSQDDLPEDTGVAAEGGISEAPVEGVAALSAYEEVEPAPIEELKIVPVPVESHRVEEVQEDDLGDEVANSPAFVLHDDRSEMVMDLAKDPDTYNPERTSVQEGPVPDQDSESIEIIEDFPEEDSWK